MVVHTAPPLKDGMTFYQLNFAVLVTANAALAYRQYRKLKRQEKLANIGPEIENSGEREESARFTKDFFTVYLLVVAADWLQVCIKIAQFFGRSD